MSGMENLRYFARLYGIAGDGRCEQAIRSVGLDPELTRPVGQYSQGMRQRMSLARAILHDPKMLLLDEPFSNVDVHSAREMVGAAQRDARCGQDNFRGDASGRAAAKAWPTNLCGCEAGQIVERTPRFEAAPGEQRNEFAPVHHPGDADERYPAGVALQDAINSMLFFSLLVVVIFSFSFDPNAEESRQIAGGLIWVAFLFAAVVALNQTWARELRNQVLDAYRVSPAPANCVVYRQGAGEFYSGERCWKR